MSVYWRLRWWLWDTREALWVRVALRMLRHHKTVYIHAHGEAPATAVLVRIDACPDEVHDVEPHSHVEGKARHA